MFATHGIFSGCAKNILKEFPNLEKIIVTNSLPQRENKDYFGDKIEVIDISGLNPDSVHHLKYFLFKEWFLSTSEGLTIMNQSVSCLTIISQVELLLSPE